MKSLLLAATVSLGLSDICCAQLDKLVPVYITIYDAPKLQGMNLILNTKDFTPAFVPGQKTLHTSTVQLVKAEQTFPPLWYQMGDPEKDTADYNKTTFILDPTIQTKNGNLTFLGNYPYKFFGAVRLDTGTLQFIDTFGTYPIPLNDTLITYVDLHDVQFDQFGNKMISSEVARTIDGRCFTGFQKDSAMQAAVSTILIFNTNDSLIFYWNSIDHIPACEMYYEYRNSSTSYGDKLNWSHFNSARFTNDGNIIYSLRHIGLGKINRQTGEIMWKLGGKDPNAISLPDTAGYYLQHDFLQRPDGLYSVFSNGDSAHYYLEGMVYQVDEVHKTAQLVDHYRPQPDVFSNAMGNYDCQGDTCVIGFGINFFPSSTVQRMGQILIGDEIVADIATLKMNFSYQVKHTKWSAIQRRPKVSIIGNTFVSDSLPGLHDYIWYKIQSYTAVPVGSGKIYTPISTGNYVVEAQQDTGMFKSFLVSDIITNAITKVNEQKGAEAITVYPNPANDRIFIKGEVISTEIFSLDGKKLLSSSKNEISITDLVNGMYAVRMQTKFGPVTRNIIVQK